MGVNLTGSFLCAHHAVRIMKAQDPQGGRIINNGSISAHSPRPRSVGYTTTKHAITGLTKAISLDGRPYRIACGQIDIGNAATEMTERIAAGAPQADGSVRPEPTFDPRHVAEAVLYMASLPLDANVQFLTITATTMPFIGRGLPGLARGGPGERGLRGWQAGLGGGRGLRGLGWAGAGLGLGLGRGACQGAVTGHKSA